MESKEALIRMLAEPFPAESVKFKPAIVKGNRAMALAYIDARDIQDRLDAVLSVDGWQDDYESLPDGSVICRLRLKLGKRWVTKVDVGSPSEQPDVGDRMKAAFSDALKRAAVKFGIGRYLYRLPQQWCDYDPNARKLLNPHLPAAALPKPAPKETQRVQPPKPSQGAQSQPPQQVRENQSPQGSQGQRPQGSQEVQYVTKDQANEIVAALRAAGIVHTEGALKGSTDCRGLLKRLNHALLREITVPEYRDALKQIKDRPDDFKFKA